MSVNSLKNFYELKSLIYLSGLYSASTALLKLAGFLLFLWLARTLSVDDYASFGLLFALQTGFATFALAGIVEAVTGLMKEYPTVEERNKLFAAANTAFVLMALISIVFVLLLFVTLVQKSHIAFLEASYVLVSGLLVAFSSLQSQIVRLEENHHLSLCFSFLSPLAGLLGSFIAFFLERTVQSFFCGSVVGLSISLFGLWIYRVSFYGLLAWISETRFFLLRVVPFIPMTFLGWLSGYGNNYVIKMFFQPAEVARFTLAFTLSSILQLIASSLNQAWSPRFYRITHELTFDEVEKENSRFYYLQGIVLGLVGGIVIMLFPLTTSILGRNFVAYQSMRLEIFLLFSSYVLLIPWWHCQNYYLAHGMGSNLTKNVLITSVVGIPVWFLLMWLLGPIGIYIGFMTQMLLRSIGVIYGAKKIWPINISWDGIATGILVLLGSFVLSGI